MYLRGRECVDSFVIVITDVVDFTTDAYSILQGLQSSFSLVLTILCPTMEVIWTFAGCTWGLCWIMLAKAEQWRRKSRVESVFMLEASVTRVGC
jgi:hypothetical protein